MTLAFKSYILILWGTGEERGRRERTGFSDNFAALWAGFLMAKELLAFFERKFTNRFQGREFFKSIVL